MVIDELAGRWRLDAFKQKFGGELSSGEVAGSRCVLLKPLEYMNLSGRAVQRAAAFFQVEPKAIVVVHDEIDLEFGRMKLKSGGGHAGHNGLRSIVQELGSPEFARVRLGVGRPGARSGQVADHVLAQHPLAQRRVGGHGHQISLRISE